MVLEASRKAREMARLLSALALLATAVAVGCGPATTDPERGGVSPQPSVTPRAAVPAATASANPTWQPEAPDNPASGSEGAAVGTGPTPAQPGGEAAGGSVDARAIVLTGTDLDPRWVEDATSWILEPGRSTTSFQWSQAAGRESPEGLTAISCEVVVYGDAASARSAVVPLASGFQIISAPEVGELSRAYTSAAGAELVAVCIESVAGHVWMKVGVTGIPRSEVKVTRAADLARLMLSRIPASRVLSVDERVTVSLEVAASHEQGGPSARTGKLPH